MYTGLGAYITSMCNVSQVNKTSWFFYVNGVKSPVGVSNYVVADLDNLLMVYETYTKPHGDESKTVVSVLLFVANSMLFKV